MGALLICALLSAMVQGSHANGDAPATTTCFDTLAEDRRACFENRTLALTSMPKNLDTQNPFYHMLESTLTLMDPNVHCSNPQGYAAAARCVVNISKSCYDPDGDQNNVMDADAVVNGMKILCDKRGDVNMECFKHFYESLDNCKTYHSRASSDDSQSSDTFVNFCRSSDIMYDCMEALITPMCGKPTADIFLEQMDKYTIPPACTNGFRPSRQRTRKFATLNDDDDKDDDDGGAASFTSPLISLYLLLVSLVVRGWSGMW